MFRRKQKLAALDTTGEDEVQFHATNKVAEKMPMPPHGKCGLLADPAECDPED